MTDHHPRNTGPMRAAARCGAATPKGTACCAPAIAGQLRCRMHGGKGSGAPKHNTNALKSGHYSAETVALRKHVNRLVRESRKNIENL
jgi:hypothetical protein